MKTLQQMLRELAREEVTEFAVVSDRLPCIKAADAYTPIDDRVLTTEDILAMLVAVGGSRYVEEIQRKPAHWAIRVDGVGTVDVHAIMRAGRAQARFTVASRSSSGRQRAAAPVSERSGFPSSGSMAVAQTVEGFESHRASQEPVLRGAVVTAAKPAAREDGRDLAPPARDAGRDVAVAARDTGRDLTSLARDAGRDLAPPSSQGVASPGSMRAAEPRTLEGRLSLAREAGASDVHIVPGRPMLLRIAGELVARGQPLIEADVDAMLAEVVPERLRAPLEEHGSCDFAFERRGIGRFRVNVAAQRSGRKGCFRCIAPGVPTLGSLGLPPEIERATHHHQGLVLVTGPTGHGKTSTLAAIVDIINRGTTHHIITVEDPVEYVHPRAKAMISQREVGSHTRSFASALKGSLREDPDVIVVGELRDTETVRMALAASETGHLVIGTMNTPSAAKTIDRMIDLFPPADQQQVRMTLAGGLHLIVGQRLVPAADGKGMAAAVELLTGSVALWSLIRDNKTFQIPSLQQRGKGFGIVRLDESLAELVKAGKVTREVAAAFAESPDELDALVGGKRQPPPAPEPMKRAPEPTSLVGKAGALFGKRGG